MARPRYDVFLSHMSGDKPAVEELARILKRKGIEPWLDKWNLVPGAPWQAAIEEALENCAAVAVCIGPSGTGPWQNEEMRTAIDLRVTDKEGDFRVIPVLLPGGMRGERSRLPRFLAATTWVEFRDELDDEFALHRLVCGIRGIEPGPGPAGAVAEGACPFRGLEFFDVDDSLFFFGREALTEWLLDKLRPSRSENRFLAIVGPSGSGKSSLARAGLLAGVKSGELPGSTDWPAAILKPGAQPLESLAVALAKAAKLADASSLLDLIGGLGKDARTLHLTIRLAFHDGPDEQRIVLLVDQFEEIFTLCNDDDERQAFIDNLLHAATAADGRTLVLLTLRADFYGRCAADPGLAAALSDRQVLVGAMTPDELRRAIERPAALAGCELESGLAELLLEEVVGRPGSLPLLQHALLELWNRRRGNRLTLEAYHVIGGVKGALEKHAETTYEDLAAEQEICRRVLLRLVQIDETTVPTRCRLLLDDLKPADEAGAEAVEGVVRKLADARLLTTGETDNPTVELAHEALITNWKRLKDWIEADREALLVRRRLGDAIREWIANQKDPSYLYRDARLAQAEVWASTRAAELTRSEGEFLDASLALRDAERRREQERAQKLKRLVIALAIGFALALLAGALAFWAYRDAQQRRLRALADHVARGVNAASTRHPVRGLLLAIQAVRLAERGGEPHLPVAETALRKVLAETGGRPLPTGQVEALAVSADRRWLATVGADERILLWEMAEQDPALVLRASAAWQGSQALLLAVSSGGRRILIGDSEGAHLLTPQAHGAWSSRLLPDEDWPAGNDPFSPNGRWLATRNLGTLVLRDLKSTSFPKPAMASETDAVAVTFSAESRQMAAATKDGTVELWSLQGARARPVPLPGSSASARALAFSADGTWLAAALGSGTEENARAWRLGAGGAPTEPQALTGCVENPHITASPLGAWFLTWGAEVERCLWKLDAGTPSLLYHQPVSSVAFSSDGHLLALGDSHGSVKVWKTASLNPHEPLFTLSRQVGPVHLVAFSPGSRWLLTQGGDEAPRVWDLRRGDALSDLEPTVSRYPAASELLAFHPSGRRLFVFSSSLPSTREVRIVDSAGKPAPRPLGDAEEVSHPRLFSRDGNWLAAAGPHGTLLLWQLGENGTASRSTSLRRHEGQITALAFSPDGRWLASGDEQGFSYLWNLQRIGAAPGQLTNHKKKVSALAFSPDGRLLATGSEDTVVRLRPLDGAGLASADSPAVPPRRGPVEALAFSPDGWLAIAVQGNSVLLWKAQKKQRFLESESRGDTYQLAFSPDGHWLASGGSEVDRLWRLDRQGPADSITMEFQGPWFSYPIAFSKEGHKLLTVHGLQTIRSWELRRNELMARACEAAGRDLTRDEWEDFLQEEPYEEGEPCSGFFQR